MDDYLKLFNRADAVVAITPDIAGPNLVPTTVQNELLKRLHDTRNYRRISDVGFAGSTLGEIYIRIPRFIGFTPQAGWSAEETLPASSQSSGPEPIHWGVAPETKVRVKFPTSGHLLLNVTAT